MDTNIFQKNNREVAIVNDDGKFTVKSLSAQAGVTLNEPTEIIDSDNEFRQRLKKRLAEKESERENELSDRATANWEKYYKRRAIGKRIKNIRKKQGVTQFDLAYAIGLSPNSIGSLEGGYNSLSKKTYQKIADALAVDYDYIINGDDHDNVADVLYFGSDIDTATAIAKLYLASSLGAEDFKNQISTILEAVSGLGLTENLREILAS